VRLTTSRGEPLLKLSEKISVDLMGQCYSSFFFLVEPRISLLVTWYMVTDQVRLLGPGRDIGSIRLLLLS
jgi:hypothetical protein